MALSEILCIVKEYSGPATILLVIGMSIIQFTPIQFNPWTKLFSFIGKALNKDLTTEITKLNKEVKNLDTKLENLESKVNENSVIDCRARIIRFGDEVSHGTTHSRDHFQMIMHDITTYDQYCAEHPEFKNNMTRITSELIEEDYKEREKTGNFL